MRVATEVSRQATQLQEMELAMRRLDQLMNQADQRAKDAEDKASAAVTAISMAKIPDQKKVKLNNATPRSSGLRLARQTEYTRRASRS